MRGIGRFAALIAALLIGAWAVEAGLPARQVPVQGEVVHDVAEPVATNALLNTAAAAGVEYTAAIKVGVGMSVAFASRAPRLEVRYRVPVTRTSAGGKKRTRLVSRTVRMRVKKRAAHVTLPLDAVSPRVRPLGLRPSVWVPIAVTPAGPTVKSIAVGDIHACALISDGTVRCWGANHVSEIGDGTTTNRPAPVRVAGLEGVSALTAGRHFSCAVVSGGSVRCWGWNAMGQLGDGTTTDRATPVVVPGLTGVTALSSGDSGSCALLADGSAKCWGSDFGDGDGKSAPFTPVEIPAWSGATAVFADGYCAVMPGGTVSCLDPRDSADHAADRAATVPGISGATTIVAAGQSRCALLGEGSVACWGYPDPREENNRGIFPSTPVRMAGVPGAVALTANAGNACAVLRDGSAACWVLADRDVKLSATPVAGLSHAVAISESCALISDGTVRCWGTNWRGQVGDGTNIDRPKATKVVGLTGVTALGPASHGGIAVLADGSVRSWGENVDRLRGDGTRRTRFAPVVTAGLGSLTTAMRSQGLVAELSSKPRAQISGSFRVDARGRVVVALASDARQVKLTYRSAADRPRTASVRIAVGVGTRTLPKGANTIHARALATRSLRASAPLLLSGQVGSGAGADLVASGMMLAGLPPVDRNTSGAFEYFGSRGGAASPEIAVDGAGAVWVKGMWRLTRLDPATGQVQTWDAASDAVFSRIQLIAPAAGAGVWLVAGDRIRKFDGQRFSTDLQVPASVFNAGQGPGAVGHIHDIADTGSGLWVSLHDVGWDEQWVIAHKPAGPLPARRIALWSGGKWKLMSTPQQGIVGSLAIDATGAAWAGGWVYPEGDVSIGGQGWTSAKPRVGVRRWNGSSWQLPGRKSSVAKGKTGQVVADPTGGVWLLAGDNAGTKPQLLHFDGRTWRKVSSNLSAVLGKSWFDGSFDLGNGQFTERPLAPALSVAPDGSAWLAGPKGVARYTRKGRVTRYGVGQGVVGVPVAAPAMVGDQVLLLDGSGVLRRTGGRFTRIWNDATIVPAMADRLLGVSATEAWVFGWDPGTSGRWFRSAAGTWQQVGGRLSPTCGAVLASDGAVWTTTPAGLTRTLGADSAVVAAGLTHCPEAAGPSGSVWVRTLGDAQTAASFVAYRPDGNSKSVPVPAGTGVTCGFIASGSGQLLVETDTEDCDDRSGSAVLWDGTAWSTFPADPATNYLMARKYTDDGAVWALASGETPLQVILTRRANGQLNTIARFGPDDTFGVVVPAPGGRVCAARSTKAARAIVCYGQGGEVARFDTTGMQVSDFSVAPDGAVWVAGPQVARLGRLAS